MIATQFVYFTMFNDFDWLILFLQCSVIEFVYFLQCLMIMSEFIYFTIFNDCDYVYCLLYVY